MTVAQLIAALQTYPPGVPVRLMSDPEGNDDRPLAEVGDMGDPERLYVGGFAVALWPGHDRPRRGEE